MNTSVQPSFQNNSLNAGQKNTSNLPFHQNNTNNQSTGNFASNFSNTKPLETLGNLKGPSNNAGFQADPTVKIGNAPMTGTTNNIFNRNPN